MEDLPKSMWAEREEGRKGVNLDIKKSHFSLLGITNALEYQTTKNNKVFSPSPTFSDGH